MQVYEEVIVTTSPIDTNLSSSGKVKLHIRRVFKISMYISKQEDCKITPARRTHYFNTLNVYHMINNSDLKPEVAAKSGQDGTDYLNWEPKMVIAISKSDYWQPQ